MNAEILLFDGFDELDALGPVGGPGRPRDRPRRRDRPLVTLEGARDVRADHGAVVRSARRPVRAPGPAARARRRLVRPAPEGAWAQAQRGEIPAAIAARHAAGTIVASVCTGALLLAASGILDGRRATTNPRRVDDLRARGTIDVVEARVVDDGDVLTAGAPACGLDLALHCSSASAAPAWPRPPRASCSTSGRQTGQASSRSASARRNRAARAPSSARWSQLMHRYVMCRIAIESLPSSSVTTTGRLTTASVSRIATCGWLITGVAMIEP